VDSYDTLKSGVPNAIIVAKEMEARGQQLNGIRLDSGDLAYLSKKARKMLDDAGLKTVKIIASNQLNEHVIKTLLQDQFAAIDAFGIGTELVTGKSDAALDGVYKLVEIDGQPKMKFSENIEKNTLPSKKQLYRVFDENGNFYRDVIAHENEDPGDINTIYHPVYPEKKTHIKGFKIECLLNEVLNSGKIVPEKHTPMEIHKFLESRASQLPDEHKRFISPHIYKVGITQKLMETRNALSKQIKNTL
jgi:nicotinate phosphoribosyltransferase